MLLTAVAALLTLAPSDLYEERYDALIHGRLAVPPCEADGTLGDAALGYRAAVRRADYPRAVACIEAARRLLDAGAVPEGPALAADLDRMEGIAPALKGRARTRLEAAEAAPEPVPDDCKQGRPKVGGVSWWLTIGEPECVYLLLDTGASVTALSPAAARALGATDERAGFATLPDLAIGSKPQPLVLRDGLVKLFTEDQAAALAEGGIDGVIGLHAFATGVIARGDLLFPTLMRREDAARPDPEAAIRMTATYDGSMMRIPLDADDADGVTCLVDTGASGTMLPRGVAARIGEVAPEKKSIITVRGREAHDVAADVVFDVQGLRIELGKVLLAEDDRCIIGMDVLYGRLAYLDLANVELWFRADVNDLTGLEGVMDRAARR